MHAKTINIQMPLNWLLYRSFWMTEVKGMESVSVGVLLFTAP